MRKNWLLAIVLTSVLAAVALTGCSPVSTTLGEVKGINISNQQEGIWVTGQGKVTAAPDIAILRLGIESQETSVAAAQSRAAEAMGRVMTALTENGIAEKDIKTQYFNIQRITRWDNDSQQEVVIGYRVTNMVTAKIREIDNVGVIIDAAAAAGGDLTRIDSIGFSVDDPSAYYQEARQKAIADAKVKAEQLAELAEVRLGKPTYISESSYVPSPIYRQDMIQKAAGAPAVETPISPGEIKISLDVQISYAILD